MSLRIDTSEWLSGALVIGETGLGVLAENIAATGDHGPGYAYNSLSLPADNGKEICGTITTWPTSGALFAYEDTSYEFSGAPDGSYWFDWQLRVDGVAVGSPVRTWLQVGPASAQVSAIADDATAAFISSATTSAQIAAVTDDAVAALASSSSPVARISAVTDEAVASFSASVGSANVSAQIAAVTDDVSASFAASVQGSPVSAQIAATTGESIFSGGAGSSPLCFIGATTQDAVFYGSAIGGALAQWPIASDVRLGVTYGPTGVEYTGTMTDGGSYPSAESIAAAVLAALQGTTIPVNVTKVHNVVLTGSGTPADRMRPA